MDDAGSSATRDLPIGASRGGCAMIAKYASTCPTCGRRISPGDSMAGRAGSPARHAKCPARASGAGRGPLARRPSEPPSLEAAPYARGMRREPCTRAQLGDWTGQVLVARPGRWAHVRQGAVADPIVAGSAYYVVAQTACYCSAEQADELDDPSGAGWDVDLYLRAATEEEAAPALAAYAAAQAQAGAAARREARLTELAALCRGGVVTLDTKRPPGRSIIVHAGVHGSGEEILILAEDGTAVHLWASGHYDDYRSSMQTTRDPRAIAMFDEI